MGNGENTGLQKGKIIILSVTPKTVDSAIAQARPVTGFAATALKLMTTILSWRFLTSSIKVILVIHLSYLKTLI